MILKPSLNHPSEIPDSYFSSCVCPPNSAFPSWKRRSFKLEEINFTHTQRYFCTCARNGIIPTWSRCGRFYSVTALLTQAGLGMCQTWNHSGWKKPPGAPRHIQVPFPAPISLKTSMDASGLNLGKFLDPQGQEVVPW